MKVDWVGHLTEHLAYELIRVSRPAQDPREFLVSPEVAVAMRDTPLLEPIAV
jgi:hypothetical protein